jgi:hypothetical protein
MRLELTREVPDTLEAWRFEGEPMVQSFTVPGGGYVWITTAEALQVPGFGREWVAAQLAERDDLSELADGLRLRAGAPLALAA